MLGHIQQEILWQKFNAKIFTPQGSIFNVFQLSLTMGVCISVKIESTCRLLKQQVCLPSYKVLTQQVMLRNEEQTSFCFPSSNYPFIDTRLEEVNKTVETKEHRYYDIICFSYPGILGHLV